MFLRHMSPCKLGGTLLLLYFLLVALFACTPPRTILWSKPGAPQSDFPRDRYACTQESRVSWSAGGSGALGLGVMIGAEAEAQHQSNRLFALCMEARGYTGTVIQRQD